MKLPREDQLTLVREFLDDGTTVKKQATGDSMLPTIPDGAILEIQPFTDSQPRLGDILYFISDQGLPLIHRVSRVFQRKQIYYFQAWGDNNPEPDCPVEFHHILGRVSSYEGNERHITLSCPWLSYLKFFFLKYSYHYSRLQVKKWIRRLSAITR